MKSLYLGMAMIALVLIALSISIETSVGKNIKLLNKNNKNRNNYNNNEREITTAVTYSLGMDSLHNTSPPERSYGPNNLNKIFLRKYYNKNYPNNVQISNKFYVPN